MPDKLGKLYGGAKRHTRWFTKKADAELWIRHAWKKGVIGYPPRYDSRSGLYVVEIPPAKKNPTQSKKVVLIYGRVIRVIAKKTQAHSNCDAECKKCNHEYFHDFKAGAVMYGLPDGSILIKKG